MPCVPNRSSRYKRFRINNNFSSFYSNSKFECTFTRLYFVFLTLFLCDCLRTFLHYISCVMHCVRTFSLVLLTQSLAPNPNNSPLHDLLVHYTFCVKVHFMKYFFIFQMLCNFNDFNLFF